MINGGRNHKRPYKVERSSLTEELTFPSIPRNRLTDKPIILKGMIEGHQVKKMQVFIGRFLGQSIPSLGFGRPSSDYGKGRKKQDCANGICNSKVSFTIKCHMGRTRMRCLGAMGLTIHSMIKFSMDQGIVIMEKTKEALWECRQLENMHSLWKET
nr:hypothetical protein [Tanacetum cinerariifolium]